jgi:hypothetical protein
MVSFINELVYFQGRCVEYFEDANTIDFCYNEIALQSFKDENGCRYVYLLVTLLRNFSAELKNDFNWYLVDFGFCDKVSARMHSELVVDNDIVGQLMDIRTNIMLEQALY